MNLSLSLECKLNLKFSNSFTRAEIPLDKNNEECYPVGLGYDTTSTVATPVGEGAGPPSPLLYLLSSDGLLCPYYCVNYKSGTVLLLRPIEYFAS